MPFAAMKTGRPVKWTEDRAEHLISANHSREHVCEIELAVKNDGTILGMRAQVLGALGGYVRTHGASVPTSTTALLPGPYYIPNYEWDVKCVLTNKVGMGTFSAPAATNRVSSGSACLTLSPPISAWTPQSSG